MIILDIKNQLKAAKPDTRVYFDFCQCVPTRVDSWRGIYAEPALGWSPSGYSKSGPVKYPTVGDLLIELDRATSGDIFCGWKGGEYAYSDNDTLHVDNPGDCTYTDITSIKVSKWEVVIHTTKIKSDFE